MKDLVNMNLIIKTRSMSAIGGLKKKRVTLEESGFKLKCLSLIQQWKNQG
jgi:hypothetical protein